MVAAAAVVAEVGVFIVGKVQRLARVTFSIRPGMRSFSAETDIVAIKAKPAPRRESECQT